MITYEITIYKTKGKKDKPHHVNGSESHKAFILSRNLEAIKENPKYDVGNEVWANGINMRGSILDIISDPNEVEWEGLKVKCIEVYFWETNTSMLFHPSELKE